MTLQLRWITLVLIGALSSTCFAGWYTGNAGDVYSAEFILTGRDLVQKLRLARTDAIWLPDANQLNGIVESVVVHSEETVFNNGHEVDAANLWPQKSEIILNQSRWRQVRRATETRQRFLIVLHEYLWMMGVEDLSFKYSAPIIDLLNIGRYSPNIFWNPVNPVNILELALSSVQSNCYFSTAQFNTEIANETAVVQTQGDCLLEEVRKVVVTKFSNVTPPSSGVRGIFHRYGLEVFGPNGTPMGSLIFEPEWGRCLRPDDVACRFSGKIIFSGIEMTFGFLHKTNGSFL